MFMSERTADAPMTVEEDGIRVEKSFSDDEFPVPAVSYNLSSTRGEPARVRIIDAIPESFPMDRVGFHPDYESENWTAYKDHRVEFDRVLEPGEAVETVFGIRSDDPDLDGFLSTPVIEYGPVDEEIEDVLGTDDHDAVREVLSGDRATLPGMERDGDSDDQTRSAPNPRQVATDTSPAVTHRQEEDPIDDSLGSGGGMDEVPDAGDNGDLLDGGPEADDLKDGELGTEAAAEESAADGSEEPVPAVRKTGERGIAAALAAEIRSGDVADEDLEVLRSELDGGVPRSVDVRIRRLQSTVADIEAYSDALEEFIDEQGTAEAMLDELRSRIDTVESDVAALSDRADAADEERAETAASVEDVESSVVEIEEIVAHVERTVRNVEDDVESVTEDVEDTVEDVAAVESELTGLDEAVDDLGDDVETLYEELDSTAADVTAVDDRVDGVEGQFDTFDEELGDVWEDIAEVDSRLTTVEDQLGDDVEDLEAELDEIRDHLTELDEFRERLSEAFGP